MPIVRSNILKEALPAVDPGDVLLEQVDWAHEEFQVPIITVSQASTPDSDRSSSSIVMMPGDHNAPPSGPILNPRITFHEDIHSNSNVPIHRTLRTKKPPRRASLRRWSIMQSPGFDENNNNNHDDDSNDENPNSSSGQDNDDDKDWTRANCPLSMLVLTALRVILLGAAISGVITLTLGILWSQRPCLIAGTLLLVLSIGVSLQCTLGRNPHRVPIEPRHILGDPLLNDFPTLAAQTDEVESGQVFGQQLSNASFYTLSSAQWGDSVPQNADMLSPRHSTVALAPESSDSLASASYLAQRRLSRRLSAVLTTAALNRKYSSTSHHCHGIGASHSVLHLARKLSSVGEMSAGGVGLLTQPWGSRPHERHRYRRSLSHPWEMARPERHYLDYE